MPNRDLFVLKNSEQVRRSITQKQQKEIYRLYNNLYKEIKAKINRIGENSMKKQELIVLKKIIESRMDSINKDIESGIVSNMTTVCETVVEDTKEYLLRCGFKKEDITDAFIYVPKNVVHSIITGNIYQSGWRLSEAIWGYDKKVQDSLNKIIGIDTAQGKSAYEVAKDIEQFVDPRARKKSKTMQSWVYKDGNKVSEKFYFGRVDYNAQRLARTLISHSYQQAFEMVNRDNPFVTGYKWLTSNFHGRVCEICRDRAETDKFGLGVGVFPKGELPLDHPNGMCTFEAVIDMPTEQIGEMIDQWYLAPLGTYPDIDKFAKSFLK